MQDNRFSPMDKSVDDAIARTLARAAELEKDVSGETLKNAGGTGAPGHKPANPHSEAISSAPEQSGTLGRSWAQGQKTSIAHQEGIPHCRLHDGERGRGLYLFSYRKAKSGELIELAPEFVCGELHVMALARDADNKGWSYILAFNDDDGTKHRITVPRASLFGDGMELLRELANHGLTVSIESDLSRELRRHIQFSEPETRVRRASKTGWFGDTFVLPDDAIGPHGDELVEFQHSGGDGAHVETEGSFEVWRDRVSIPNQDNTRVALAMCVAFAAPCLELAGVAGGGFHLRGGSSAGKSTAQYVASSICGSPDYMRSWRTTDNNLEGVATMHNGLMLCLDEIGECDPRVVGACAYMLSNGKGKGRASKDGSSRKVKTWAITILSSGERSLADMTTEGGKRPMAGQEVRIVDVPADPGRGFGLFDTVPDGMTPKEFADEITAITKSDYGHALPMFLRHIVEDKAKFRERLLSVKAMVYDKLMELAPKAGGQVGRVADRFALVAAAGELATDAGITGWSCGAAYRAAAACFRAWLDGRGTSGNAEPAQMRKQVGAFLDTHEEGRFTDLNASEPEGKRAITNRAGWRGYDDGASIFYIIPTVFEGEVCRGFDPVAVCAALIEVAALKTDRGKRTVKKTIGDDRPRVYAILKNALEDAD